MNTLAFLETHDLQALAPLLRTTLLSVRIETSGAVDPGLAVAVRGAFGHALKELAGRSEAARDAWATLFADKVGLTDSKTPPYRIAVDPVTGGFMATLTLIGFADRYRTEAFDAFFDGIASRLVLPDGASITIAGEPFWTRREGVPVPQRANIYRLEFLSPLRIGPRGALGTRFSDIPISISQHLAALLPWTGIDWQPRLGHWREAAKRLKIDTSRLVPVAWETRSSLNGLDRGAGYLGSLSFHAPDEDLATLLAIGSVIHAGKSPAKGYGRYRLIPEA